MTWTEGMMLTLLKGAIISHCAKKSESWSCWMDLHCISSHTLIFKQRTLSQPFSRFSSQGQVVSNFWRIDAIDDGSTRFVRVAAKFIRSDDFCQFLETAKVFLLHSWNCQWVGSCLFQNSQISECRYAVGAGSTDSSGTWSANRPYTCKLREGPGGLHGSHLIPHFKGQIILIFLWTNQKHLFFYSVD